MYGVIASPDKEQALMEIIGEQIVYSSFQKSDKPEQLKRILEMAARVPLNTLIVDVSLGQSLVDAINAYRIQRPAARVILLAGGLVPGDSTIAAAVRMGIYDIVSADDWGAELKEVLDQIPADYSAAAHWDVQIDINDEKESLGKGLFKRFIKQKEINGIQEIKDVFADMESNTDKPFFPVPTGFVNVPDDFVAIGHIQGVRSFSSKNEVLAAAPAVILVSASSDTVTRIKDLRREPSLLHVPIVVIGQTEEMLCYKAGADECYKVLNEETVERIRARADRMRDMWEKASRDDLTGLFKRKYLEDYLVEQEKRYKSIGMTFSLLLADLDHFKFVNDTYGHQAGDLVLKEFAAYLQGSVRRVDVVARYGGEEFVVVFPNLGDAGRIAEKLCSGWAKKDIFIEGTKVRSTFSAGLAVMGKNANDVTDLIRVADKALYRAKEEGRNRVIGADCIRNDFNPGVIEFPSENASTETTKWITWPLLNFKQKLAQKPRLTQKSNNVVAVISAEGAGKTTIAVNLAITLAMRGYSVAFIDGDIESLKAHYLVGGGQAGSALSSALENPSDVLLFLENVPFVPQLYTLTADPDFMEIHRSFFSKLPEVIKKVSALVDFVVLDTPPIEEFDEFDRRQRITKTVGQSVLVVSPYEGMEFKIEKLSKPVLVLNRWPAGVDISIGEQIYGQRAISVIPEIEDVIQAERDGVPAVLFCQQLYQALQGVADSLVYNQSLMQQSQILS